MKQKLFVTFILALIGMLSYQAFADTVSATSNTSSGIQHANYTATLSDGTILGYYYSYDEVYFCGAISTFAHVIVPNEITIGSTTYDVTQIGQYNLDQIDLTKSPATKELTFGNSITNIRSAIPVNVENIHFKSLTPPQLGESSYIPTTTIIWCPQSAYSSYQAESQDRYSEWYEKVIHYENWTPKNVTVNVRSAGSFANELLKIINQWNEVNELVVIGSLNDDDMKYFSRLSNLSVLDLSETDIKNIGGCTGLKYLSKVVLPTTVKTIKGEAFSGCINLKDFDFSQIIEIEYSGFYNCKSLTNIDAPNLKTIGSACFASCSNLTSISAPKISDIPSNAFKNCSELSSFDFSNITSLGTGAFSDCSKLESVNALNLKEVDHNSSSVGIFSRCSSLANVSLGNAITTIPNYMFEECTSLTKLEIPQSVKSIGYNAFADCPLNEINFPEGTTSIGGCLFGYQSVPLKKATIPSTIEYIAEDAFNGCNSITDFYCYAAVPPEVTGFYDSSNRHDMDVSGINLHVPEFAVSSYKLSDNWFKFAQIISIQGNINQLNINSNYTIYDYTGLSNDINLRLSYSGHLTIDAGSPLSLNNYIQLQNFKSERNGYYDENDNYVYNYTYPYCTTLITDNEVRANNITTKVQLPTNRWSFLSLPYDVNVSNIIVPEGTMWVVRKYNGANRAAMSGDTWENVTSGQMLNAGEGYIFHCITENGDSWDSDSIYFEFPAVNNSNKNNIFSYEDVVKTIKEYPAEFSHNRGWNLIGNPYPTYMSSQYIDFPAPITVWNGDGYTAYSLADDEYVLRPNEAFFVQCPVNTTQIKFFKDGRKHNFASSSNPYRSRAKIQQPTNRSILNFILSNDSYSDRTRLVLNETASCDYEIERDASKFMSSNETVPQIYIIDNGVKYAINERPLGSGECSLGVHIGKDGIYNIALNSNDSEYEVLLIDNQTNKIANLNSEPYSFESKSQTANNRFTIKINAKGNQSSIEDIDTNTVGFYVSGNRLYIDQNVTISLYSIDGKLVYSGIVDGSVELSSGIYILSINDTNHKIAIK